MATTLENLIDQALDIAGSATHNSMPYAEESAFLGRALAGQVGAAANVVAGAGAGNMRVSGLANMLSSHVGGFLTLGGAAAGGNNGTFLIYAFVNVTTVDVVNAAAVVPDGNNGAIVWTQRRPYTLQSEQDFERTDRANIKGVAFDAAIPVYERPTAIGTDVDANLNNIAGKTADALATVRNVYNKDLKLPPSIADDDGNVLIADETITFTKHHFTADDVDSFVTLVDGTSVGAAGTYRVKAVTDGKTLELDGLAATGAGTCTWTREGDLKGILTSRGYADTVDRTGVPVADAGAEDETFWDATHIEVLSSQPGGEISTIQDETANRIWGRSFGDAKDPNKTVTNEASRLFMQLMTGDNDAGASVSAIEPVAGGNGSAASLPGANKTVTGLTGMTEADIGLYLTLWNLAADEAGHYKITAVPSATSATVERAAGNFTADASGAVNWQLSRHSGILHTFHPDRFRNDNLNETWARTVLIGGSGGTSELVIDIDEIRDTIGILDGDTDLSAYLTNTGNFFAFSDLPDATPSVVEALNVLNAQIGDRDWDDPAAAALGLIDGELLTDTIQKIADAVSASSIVRTIEELAAPILPGVTHNLPGGIGYTPDGTGHGANLWLYTRCQLRHPGPNVAKHEYEEVAGAPSTQILIKRALNATDILDYFILQ